MFEQMSNKNKLSLLIAVGLLFVVTLALCLWLLWPKYEQLAGNLSLEQSADVIKRLDEQNIEYELTNQGQTVAVLSEQLDTALVNLASTEANPKSKGLELYETVDYSMTEHIQDVTYKRATQGELERTLEQFTFIKSARVHITFANRSLFNKQNQGAKASVFVVLVPGENPSVRQILAVQNLVATSVENLAVEDVTVLDHKGGLLRANDANINQEFANSALDVQIEDKVTKILSLYFIPEQFAVTARVETHNDERKEVTQSVLTQPGQAAVVKEKREYTQKPTTDTQPKSELDKRVELEYAHGKKVEEVVYRANRIKRLSLAVAIQADMTSAQSQQLKRLVAAAAGLNLMAGDNLSFEVLPLPQAALTAMPVLPPASIEPNTQLKIRDTNNTSSDLEPLVTAPVEPAWRSPEVTLPTIAVLLVILFGALVKSLRTNALSQHKREEVLIEVNKWLTVKEGER